MDVNEAARLLLDIHLANREPSSVREATELEKIFTSIVEEGLEKTSLFKADEIKELFLKTQDIRRVTFYKNMTREQLWLDCSEKMTRMIQGIIEFAKLVPSFMKLPQDDQIVLLKGNAFELIILRLSRYMDLNTGQVLIAHENVMLPEDAFYTQDTKEMKFITLVFTLAKSIAELKLTEAQLGIYSALILLSPGCPRLNSVAEVQRSYEITLRTLNTQLSMTAVDELIAKIPLLREASRMHIDALARFKRSHEFIEFPPLYKELFNLNS